VPVDLSHGQLDAAELDRVARPRAPAERVEHQPRHRPRIVLRQRRADGLVEVVDRHDPRRRAVLVDHGRELLVLLAPPRPPRGSG
jgi:hypothetical protein